MKISVIISTYNSSDYLLKALYGYIQQTDQNFEIIIADDGSLSEHVDKYKSVLESFPIHNQCVWHPDEGFRKNVILNKAILNSNGDYLLFTDGDCIPEPDFVACHRRNAKPNFFLSGTACKLRTEVSEKITTQIIKEGIPFKVLSMLRLGRMRNTFFIKMGAKNIRLAKLFDLVIPVKKTFNGGNSSCWKEDALNVGGFDERMRYGGEDIEFGYRLEHNGIKPKRIRHSARCVHLEHSRGYRNKQDMSFNRSIIAETLSNKLKRTPHGFS